MNGKSGGPGESRTPDTRFRKPLLYPSELQALPAILSNSAKLRGIAAYPAVDKLAGGQIRSR